MLPGEKRRIIVARQGTYKKNTKPCNVQVYNCGSGGVAPPPRRRWQPTQRQRCVPAVYTVELKLSGFEQIPWRTLPVPQIFWLCFCMVGGNSRRRQQQPSPGGGGARRGAGGRLWRWRRLTTIFHKMEKHGPRPWGTKPTSIPLGEKTRAHRHYTTAAA